MEVLIVEDEVLLALELESELESAGHKIVGRAMSSSEASSLIRQQMPDFAFVDIHLQDGPTGVDIGRHLKSIGVPYVFMTGNVKRIPDDFAGAWGAIEKPYSVNGFRNALSYLVRRLAGQAEGELIPPSLLTPSERGTATTTQEPAEV